MRVRRTAIGGIVFSLVALVTATASARQRIAVLLVAGEETDLADNLAEIAISTIAAWNEYDLVGNRELRRRLGPVLFSSGIEPCLADEKCVAHLGAAAGIDRIVIGQVRKVTSGYRLEVTLRRPTTNRILGRSSRNVLYEPKPLITALRSCVHELFGREVPPASAASSAPDHRLTDLRLPPPVHAPQTTMAVKAMRAPLGNVGVPEGEGIKTSRENDRRTSDTPVAAYLGVGAAALAGISLSSGVALGVLASGTPSGDTRPEALADQERRNDYARAANGAFLVTGALVVTAATAFLLWRRQESRHSSSRW